MKDKIDIKLSKYVVYPLYIIAIVALFGFFRGCSTSKESTRLRKEITALNAEIDSTNTANQIKFDNIYTNDELDIKMEIEGLKTSKRTLYDWNAVIRTTTRPDDRMNEYDKQIKALEKKLSN
jgi:hypothetical protein